MNDVIAATLKEDFRNWSGGFSPESREQISVYIDYAMPCDGDASALEVQEVLSVWMDSDESA